MSACVADHTFVKDSVLEPPSVRWMSDQACTTAEDNEETLRTEW